MKARKIPKNTNEHLTEVSMKSGDYSKYCFARINKLIYKFNCLDNNVKYAKLGLKQGELVTVYRKLKAKTQYFYTVGREDGTGEILQNIHSSYFKQVSYQEINRIEKIINRKQKIKSLLTKTDV